MILNRYPYTSGHVMIVPYAHVAELGLCDAETLAEMMQLAQRVEQAFGAIYKPDGMNIGYEPGESRGGREWLGICICTRCRDGLAIPTS